MTIEFETARRRKNYQLLAVLVTLVAALFAASMIKTAQVAQVPAAEGVVSTPAK